jgi:hypothetical protein
MKRFFIITAFVAALAISPQAQARESDAQVRQRLIRESIASYPGNCPCPYNTDRAGRRCGGRSAYNRAGGYAPLCFDRDISKEMVDRNRR